MVLSLWKIWATTSSWTEIKNEIWVNVAWIIVLVLLCCKVMSWMDDEGDNDE